MVPVDDIDEIIERYHQALGELVNGNPEPLKESIVEMESCRTRVGRGEDASPVTLRLTSTFRPEGGTWKLVHRHSDPIITPQPAESVIQE